MSYHVDHMTWQQRVSKEQNAHNRNLDRSLGRTGMTLQTDLRESMNR